MTASPDGLGERLREFSDWTENGKGRWFSPQMVVSMLREAAARIDTLTEQVAEWKYRAENSATWERVYELEAENARLTEQVRGAEERLREQAHYWKRVLAHGDDGDSVMTCFEVIAAEAEAALVLAENAARASIYDEGAAGVKSVTEEKKS